MSRITRENHDIEVSLDEPKRRCKDCANCSQMYWHCKEFDMQVEPDGPNFNCGKSKERERRIL